MNLQSIKKKTTKKKIAIKNCIFSLRIKKLSTDHKTLGNDNLQTIEEIVCENTRSKQIN